MYKRIIASVTMAVAFIMLSFSVSAATSTLDNLMTAFNGETNANAKYLAFAKKADAEGYGQAASLFRAAARAEQVHFERHAVLIKEMGGTPKATMEKLVVKSTRKNLEAALAGETYESTKMYPEFLAQAELEKNKKVIDDFEDTTKAEADHARLYKSALDDLASWKGPAKDFFVCPLCGNVLEKQAGKCPICMTDSKKFIAVK